MSPQRHVWRDEEGVTRTMNDAEEFAEFMRFFGPIRGFQVVGWIVYWGVTGRPTLTKVMEVARRTGISRAGVYRYLADVKRWREHLERNFGYQFPPAIGLDELAGGMAERLGEGAQAARLAPQRETR